MACLVAVCVSPSPALGASQGACVCVCACVGGGRGRYSQVPCKARYHLVLRHPEGSLRSGERAELQSEATQ